MCYCGCPYESYPEGPNEECRCKRGRNACPYGSEQFDEDPETREEEEDDTHEAPNTGRF